MQTYDLLIIWCSSGIPILPFADPKGGKFAHFAGPHTPYVKTSCKFNSCSLHTDLPTGGDTNEYNIRCVAFGIADTIHTITTVHAVTCTGPSQHGVKSY